MKVAVILSHDTMHHSTVAQYKGSNINNSNIIWFSR